MRSFQRNNLPQKENTFPRTLHISKYAWCVGLDFRFRDPEANFQRSRVKGVVAKLISVKDTNTATALEVAAGGKLFQVIVDTEVTSKALIDRGQLTRRYTIIPINKVEELLCTDNTYCSNEARRRILRLHQIMIANSGAIETC